MKVGLFGAVVVIGAILMALAVVSGIGYGLYLLGVVGLTFGPAAWAGFVLWAKMFGGGFVLYIVGILGVTLSK
jgi:hypothetical protein